MDLLVLAEIDGAVDMTIEAIAGITRVPVDDLRMAIEILMKPDAQSRTPDQGGARLVKLDDHRNWGWRIVNYERYREIANDEERRAAIGRRVKKFRQKAANQSCNGGETRCNTSHTSTSASENASEHASTKLSGPELIIADKELDRVNQQIATLKATYADHQTWPKDDSIKIAKLRTRQKELKAKLGVVV